MNHHERIRENYEDAAFVLLMDRLAKEQGERYKKINDDLGVNPEFIVPEEISKECYRTIHKEAAKIRRKNNAVRIKKVFRRAAILVAILCLMITSALALSAELRVRVLNWSMEIMEDHTNITFGPASEDGLDIEIVWVPEEYANVYVSDDKALWQYEDNLGNWIILTIVEGIYIEKGGNTTLFWADEYTGYVFTLFSNALDKEDAIRVAENVFLN